MTKSLQVLTNPIKEYENGQIFHFFNEKLNLFDENNHESLMLKNLIARAMNTKKENVMAFYHEILKKATSENLELSSDEISEINNKIQDILDAIKDWYNDIKMQLKAYNLKIQLFYDDYLQTNFYYLSNNNTTWLPIQHLTNQWNNALNKLITYSLNEKKNTLKNGSLLINDEPTDFSENVPIIRNTDKLVLSNLVATEPINDYFISDVLYNKLNDEWLKIATDLKAYFTKNNQKLNYTEQLKQINTTLNQYEENDNFTIKIKK